MLDNKTQKKCTPSFTATLPLESVAKQEKYYWKLSDCARQLFNAVLSEARKRSNRIKNTKLYQETIRLPKNKKENISKRRENFKYLNEQFGFTDSSLQSFGTKTKNDSKFIAEHLGTHVCQKTSTKAFRAEQRVALRKAKKANFKRKGEFVSIEGKNNETFIRYSNGYAIIGNTTCKCSINPKDKWMQHALKQRIKYCRLISKVVKGKRKFYLQLILEGQPYQKHSLGTEETGIDVGPSTIAVVSDTKAELKEFCSELVFLDKEKRRLQRKMDRQRRKNNPDNYLPNGVVKKGRKTWASSNRYLKTKALVHEYERKLKEKRKTFHGKEVNQIVRRSKIVKAEKLSYKAFQKLFGKSVGRRAPSQFVNRLQDRMIAYGGDFQEISTYKTKLSQTCHCGQTKKKKLSDRWHRCECGIVAQRDLYSAFLAKCIVRSGTLSKQKSKRQWDMAKVLLDECVKNTKEKNQKTYSSFGF
ncbi:transposase (plasmid) [Pontibacillus sp. ALD_SL1]|uniref:RNA-guided endonuclease TnpB family protein n=1 Tax=Pontibacillus sp. ALD_SL1 TaxID=2777185 RepID=UPI001A96469C|nr:RNA-guided endonuclease TnpB family protein [Pontibacillus sp. ALD_SL1]QST02528.1 transposase [Pontibacillus sp. ALD_SL1]